MRRVLVVLATALVLAGCGAKSDPGADAPTSDEVPGPVPLQLRVVALTSDESFAPGAVPAPPEAESARFADYTCADAGTGLASDPDEYLLACDATSTKYLLAPASWSGTVKSASAQIPRGQASFAVNISLGSEGARALAALSGEVVESGGLGALVVAGRVLAAAAFNGVIHDGTMQVTGDLTEGSANALVDQLTGR